MVGLLCAGLLACSSSATQLVVVIESDLAINTELTQINALVQGAEYQPLWSNEFEITSADDLPLSFGVEGSSGSENELTIDLYAINSEGETTTTRRAVVSLIQNKSLILELSLMENCKNQSCPEPQTCISSVGGCDSWEIDASSLAENLVAGDEFSN
jgi:hypothetical protein